MNADEQHAMSGSRAASVRRRSISVGVVVALALVVVPLSLVALPVAAIVDLLRWPRRFPLSRTYLFALHYLMWECVAVAATAALWVASGCGHRLGSPRFQRAHIELQRRWAASHLAAMATLLHLRFDLTEVAPVPSGPLVCLVRHSSMIDTLIPMHVLTSAGRTCRYVLKSELEWDPALDIVGHRLPNHFVDRSGSDTDAELAAIQALATDLGDDEVVVLFPEGSRFTESKRARALEKLEFAGSPQLADARELRRTLPPRAAGVGAALAGADHADVMVLTHAGLEGLASLRAIIAAVPFAHPVRVTGWSVPRCEVPSDTESQARWLYRTWRRVDDWVQTNEHAVGA